MKIAVVGGSYDPVTLGHVYLIEQACKIADEVHALIGPNPFKNYTFTLTERREMLSLAISHTKAKVQILAVPTTVQYCQDLAARRGLSVEEITVVRGVRDERDLTYERNIERCMRGKEPRLNFFYVFSPDALVNVRSSVIKDLCIQKGHQAAAKLVPPCVLPYLSRILKQEHAEPVECFSAKDGVVEDFDDPGSQFIVFGKMKNSFSQAVACGFFKYAEEVDEHQVRGMLDHCPMDLVVSKKFRLMEVETAKLRPTGRQYLPCSQSLGPIIVDANEVLSKHPVYTVPGPVIIIDGKHRWIEAMERGDEKILAWVGDKAAPLLYSHGGDLQVGRSLCLT
jgi:pantetheine-phosphate adenylyltransferase